MSLLKYIVSLDLILCNLLGLLFAQKFQIIEQKLPEEIKVINDIEIENNTLWLASSSGLYHLENNKFQSFIKDKYSNIRKINTIE
ncbi:MAG: hypothetical protein L3J74_18125, partial [Bacteroidales bacterium]|nr:hypothetical protein [Bacteroidales bacterium]